MSESLITKKALAAVLKDLMSTSALEKISVGDICERCGLNRKSFYYHFKDKYDLVNWIFYYEFIECISRDNYETVWDFFRGICDYFYANREFYISAFAVRGQNSFSDYFEEVFFPITVEYFRNEFSDDENAEFYATFFTDAFRAGIIRWLRDNADIEPPRFCELMRSAVSQMSQKYASETSDGFGRTQR